MKNIILPNKELHLLSGLLQRFNAGYTVEQIRSLDTVVRAVEMAIKPFVEGMKKITEINTESTKTDPQEKLQDSETLLKQKEEKFAKYMEKEGNEVSSIPLEDKEIDFVKTIWTKMSTLNGLPEAREAIIKIDDALNNASGNVFIKPEKKILN